MSYPARSRATRRFLPGLLALGLLAAVPATQAQTATKIFVASTGLDTQSGARNAPVRSLAVAESLVAAGGEIVVLDTAGFGSLNITKSLAITVPPGVNGFITTTGYGLTINAAATDVVSINGLIIEGGAANATGNGIQVTSVGNLKITNCTIRNFPVGVVQDTGNASQMVVSGCSISGCGYGVLVQSEGSGTVSAVVTDCKIDTANSGGAVTTDVDSDADVFATVTHCTLTNNNFGLLDISGAIFAFGNTISGNTTGVAGNSVESFGLNVFTNNGTNGAFASTPGSL